jgi:hypothetical protein
MTAQIADDRTATPQQLKRLVWLGDVPDEFPCFTVRNLRRIRAEGKIPTYKVGSRIYFLPDDLAQLVVVEPAVAVGR